MFDLRRKKHAAHIIDGKNTAKISTQKSVGLGESSYSAPNTNTGNYPYPQNMGLAVYETTPYVSPLELFYESSTADLISDLNLSIEDWYLIHI